MNNESLSWNMLLRKTNQKLTLPWLTWKFPTFFFWVQSFVSVFTIALSLVHIFFQINAIHALLSCLFRPTLILPTYLPLALTRGTFPHQNPAGISSPPYMPHTLHISFLLDLVIWINTIFEMTKNSSDSYPLQLSFAVWPTHFSSVSANVLSCTSAVVLPTSLDFTNAISQQ